MRSDGVIRLRRAGRRRWAWLTLGGLAVILPLALSLAVLLPPVILAIPPMTLWVAIGSVLRHHPEQPARPAERPGAGRVIPLHRPGRA